MLKKVLIGIVIFSVCVAAISCGAHFIAGWKYAEITALSSAVLLGATVITSMVIWPDDGVY